MPINMNYGNVIIVMCSSKVLFSGGILLVVQVY